MTNRFTIRQADNGDYSIMLWTEDSTATTIWDFRPITVQTNIRTWEKAFKAWNEWIKREKQRT